MALALEHRMQQLLREFLQIHGVGGLIVEEPQHVFNDSKQTITPGQRMGFFSSKNPQVAELLQGLQGVRRPQLRMRTSVQQLQVLHQKLNIQQPPAAFLEVASAGGLSGQLVFLALTQVGDLLPQSFRELPLVHRRSRYS